MLDGQEGRPWTLGLTSSQLLTSDVISILVSFFTPVSAFIKGDGNDNTHHIGSILFRQWQPRCCEK